MTRSDIIDKVKLNLNEVLSPGSESVTMTLSEQPIDTFIGNLLDSQVRTLFKDVRKSLIRPYSILWAKVPQDHLGYVNFTDTDYSLSGKTVSSFDGQGSVEVITIGATTEGGSPVYSSGQQYIASSSGLFYADAAEEIELAVEIGDVLIFVGTRYYFVDVAQTTAHVLLICLPESSAAGYFKNIVLSDGYISINVHDGIIELDLPHTGYTGNFDVEPWVKEEDDAFVSFYLPQGFVSVMNMKFVSWKTNTPREIFTSEPNYQLQQNTYTRSGIAKPVVAIAKEPDRKYSIEIYSRKDAEDVLSLGTYIQTVPAELIQDDLIVCFSWLIAFNYLSAIGSQASNQAFEIYKKILSEL